MYTIDQFKSRWKRLHHPSMNVDGDVAFFYGIYVRLHHLAEQDARAFDGRLILSLLLYTENTVAIGLDGVYEDMYRSLGNVVFRWCDGSGMSANATSQVHDLVSQAVADAPCSALRQWITESVLSCDFQRLSDVLTYFAREDRVLRHVYPDLRCRKPMFLRLAGEKQAARQMLWADLAFNWQDKHGNSLPATLARQCRLTAPLMEEWERLPLQEAAGLLDTVCSERLDTYTVIGVKDGRTFTLRHRDGRLFKDVTSRSPVPEDVRTGCLAAQLVFYKDKAYISGPAVRLTDDAAAGWNGEAIWSDIFKKEHEAARQVYFTTPFGRRISLYEDLYTIPEDPDEDSYAGMGIYLDEPNIFDFLEWLKPSDNAQGVSR